MTDERREETYRNMGIPNNCKRKKLYFNSVYLFSNCIFKYLKPYTVFRYENENYGGLKEILNTFQHLIFEKIKENQDLN